MNGKVKAFVYNSEPFFFGEEKEGDEIGRV